MLPAQLSKSDEIGPRPGQGQNTRGFWRATATPPRSALALSVDSRWDRPRSLIAMITPINAASYLDAITRYDTQLTIIALLYSALSQDYLRIQVATNASPGTPPFLLGRAILNISARSIRSAFSRTTPFRLDHRTQRSAKNRRHFASCTKIFFHSLIGSDRLIQRLETRGDGVGARVPGMKVPLSLAPS